MDVRELEQVLERMDEPVVLADPRFRVRQVNGAAERLLGRARADLVGRALEDLVPLTYSGGRPTAGHGWRIEPTDGGWALFGRCILVPATFDPEWVQRMVEAEQLAAVGQLAASVAHEIGAPLTAISVAVEILLKRECGQCSFASRDLNVIMAQTRRIAQLSRRLVDLARPGEPVLREMDFNVAIREGFELLEKQLHRSNIVADLVLHPEPIQLRGDPNQLQQVFLNLVLNAEHAIGPEGGRIEVVTRNSGGEVELVVRDSGPGILPEDLGRIFLPFFSKSGGTGLGLPLARQIVHRHGGAIEVESTPGAGARFTVRLPKKSHD